MLEGACAKSMLVGDIGKKKLLEMRKCGYHYL